MDPTTKGCPLCGRELDINEFGICRARKDGRNLYCKACIRKKINDSRQEQREMKIARRARMTAEQIQREIEKRCAQAAQPVEKRNQTRRLPPKNSPEFLKGRRFDLTERVLAAIELGAQSYWEIWKMVQNQYISRDSIGDAIAKLLLETHQIRTETDGETRRFFIADPAPPAVASSPVSGSESIWRIPLAMPVLRGERR